MASDEGVSFSENPEGAIDEVNHYKRKSAPCDSTKLSVHWSHIICGANWLNFES